MSLTLTGLLVHCTGACLTGKNNSRIREPKPPNPAPQATSSLLPDAPLGVGPPFMKALKFSPMPSPYSSGIKGECTSPRTLIGRSVRNCFKFPQKPSPTNLAGEPKRGRGAFQGTDKSALSPRCRGGSDGRRLVILTGNVSPVS